MTEAGEPDVKPALRLLQFITGHWVAAAVYAAARLKLADLLEGGPKASDELADAVGAYKSAVDPLLCVGDSGHFRGRSCRSSSN